MKKDTLKEHLELEIDEAAKILVILKKEYWDDDIPELNPDFYAWNLARLEEVKIAILNAKYQKQSRNDLKVIFVQGDADMGKSRTIMFPYDPSDTYHTTDTVLFNGYRCQKVLILDDFQQDIRLSSLMRYLSSAPVKLPVVGRPLYACYHTVYIISQTPLELLYPEEQAAQPYLWEAFLQKLSEIRDFHRDKPTTIYQSADEYMAAKKIIGTGQPQGGERHA